MDDIAVERRVVLGLQHTVAMFGATILVPLILGMNPSIALLSAGIGTLMFHLVTKGIVPVFLGSSFAFLAPIGLATAEGYSFVSIGAGIMAAGVVYLIVSFLVTVIPDGSHKLRELFPPIVTGPIIAVIGITLAPIAINQAQGNWWLALVALGSVIVCLDLVQGPVQDAADPDRLRRWLSGLDHLRTGRVDKLQCGQLDRVAGLRRLVCWR